MMDLSRKKRKKKKEVPRGQARHVIAYSLMAQWVSRHEYTYTHTHVFPPTLHRVQCMVLLATFLSYTEVMASQLQAILTVLPLPILATLS